MPLGDLTSSKKFRQSLWRKIMENVYGERFMKVSQWIVMAFILSSCFLTACASSRNKEDARSPEEKKAMLYYEQGTQDLISKNYTNALSNLQIAKDLYPSNDEIRNNLGMALYLKGLKDKAKTEFEKALSLNNKNSDARNNLASLLIENKKYKEALEHLEYVVEDLTYTKKYRIYYNMGIAYKALGRPDLELDYYQKSVEENADYCPALFQIGVYHNSQYEYSKALRAFEEASKGPCTSEPAPRFEAAQVLKKLNRTAEAQKKFKVFLTKPLWKFFNFWEKTFKEMIPNSLGQDH